MTVLTLPVTPADAAASPYDVARVREDFPALAETVHGKRFAFMDTAASAQKPRAVIECLTEVYSRQYANVHRGAYLFSERLTTRFEAVRDQVRAFLNAEVREEIVFTRGATESINLVASSLGPLLEPGDQVVISGLEHHANIVPWHLLARQRGIEVVAVPVADDGTVSAAAVAEHLGPRTRLVAMTHVSNTLGTVTPMAEIVREARARDIPVLVDGCQAVPHMPVDVQALDCDFYVFSGHKLYGPNGVGVLYARRPWLDRLPPYHGGGEMIDRVTLAESTYAPPPFKFEAGTPVIAEVVAFGAALEYVERLGMTAIQAHDHVMGDRLRAGLAAVPGIRILGAAPERTGVVSFVLAHGHPADLGTLLDHQGVAIRTGHHCTQPLLQRFGLAATARASVGLYTDEADIDQFLAALDRARAMLA